MKIKITTVLTALQLFAMASIAQNTSTIKGFVKDEKGDPLPFATVLLGNGNGTDTDFNGYFSVEIPAEEEGMEMSISYTGYSAQTALWTKTNEMKPMKFWLKAGIELEAVVVVYSKALIETDCTISCGYEIRCDLFSHPYRLVKTEMDEPEATFIGTITAFPNPFISTLTLEMEVKTPQPYLFHLYNEAGQLVFAVSRDLEAGPQNFQLDLVQRHLPEGAYFLRISDGAGEVRTKRLMKVSP